MNDYLPEGLPIPAPDLQGAAAPFWTGLRDGVLRIQKCGSCGRWQWGPDYICHHCHSFDLDWREVEPCGRIYSWTRVWQAAQPALNDSVPYIVALIELDVAPNVRLIGNLLGDPDQQVEIGAPVRGVFEPHERDGIAFALLQWRRG